jgi:hypothetical protein
MDHAARLSDAIAADGFVLVERRLGPSVLDRIRQAHADQVAAATGANIRTSSCGGGTRTNLDQSHPDLRLLHADDLLRAVAARIIAAPVLKYFHSRTIHPGASAQQLHMDCDPGTAPGRLLAFIWMLDDFGATNGATRFVPDSHRGLPGAAAPFTGPAGSVIIYDRAVLHGYTPHQTNADRRSIQGGFDPAAGAPIA